MKNSHLSINTNDFLQQIYFSSKNLIFHVQFSEQGILYKNPRFLPTSKFIPQLTSFWIYYPYQCIFSRVMRLYKSLCRSFRLHPNFSWKLDKNGFYTLLTWVTSILSMSVRRSVCLSACLSVRHTFVFLRHTFTFGGYSVKSIWRIFMNCSSY